MAQSPEYPDLLWVPPRAYGSGRDGKAVRYIVIHYTAGAERNTSAEDGAAYDRRRTDGVSTHYFVDSDSVVQCVLTKNRGNAARHKGNRLGIQYELCGTVQTRAQWLDAASLPTLRNAARQVARDCKKYQIPVRRLSVAETRRAWTDFPDGPKGIVGHVDCTNAYPEDGGDHTDPGTQFPWDLFLDMVQDELEDSEMTKDEWARLESLFNAVPGDVWNKATFGRGENQRTAGAVLVEGRTYAARAAGAVAELDAQMDAYADADAERDAALPAQVAEMLGVGGYTPEQTAAFLRQIDGVDWSAVGRILAA
jgi:hypothetical protein